MAVARRTGRRPGAARTRDAILDAARSAFGTSGYDGATIRGIAGRAGVDPALVHHYFRTKEELFVAALELPMRPSEVLPQVLAGPRRNLGERVVRQFFAVWEPRGRMGPSPIHTLLRSVATNERAATMLRQFIGRELLGRVARNLGVENAAFRAGLVGSQMVGVAMLRYILRLPPIANASLEDLVRALAPTVQRYLTGNLGGEGKRARTSK
jgi:AcrR family transcriptional regulator